MTTAPTAPRLDGAIPLEFHVPHSSRRYRRIVTLDAAAPTPPSSYWDSASDGTWSWTLEVRNRFTHRWAAVAAGTAAGAVAAHHASRDAAIRDDVARRTFLTRQTRAAHMPP